MIIPTRIFKMANKISLLSLRNVFLASLLITGGVGYQACDFDFTPRNDDGTGPFLKIDIQKDDGKVAGIAALTALGTGFLLLRSRRKDQPQP